MEGAILDTMTFLETVDFAMVFRAIGIGFLLFWLVILGWVVFDAFERFPSIWARLFSFLLVLLFPIFGLFIYLIIRPKMTMEEEEWSDLERRFLKFEADGLEDCRVCGYELMPNFVYCPNCGTELRVKCESCEVYLEPQWRACPFCGTEQEKDEFVHVEEKVEKKPDVLRPVYEPSFRSEPEPAVASTEPAVVPVTSATASSAAASAEKSVEKEMIEAQPVRRGKRKSGGTVKKYFNKTMLAMDGFVKYVGNIPLKAVSGTKKTRSAESNSEKKSTEEKTATGSKADIKSKSNKTEDTGSSKSSKSKSASSVSKSKEAEAKTSEKSKKSSKSKKSKKTSSSTSEK